MAPIAAPIFRVKSLVKTMALTLAHAFAALFLLVTSGDAEVTDSTKLKTVESGDVFTIHHVKVDVTAQNAAMARTMAIAAGEKQAFAILMGRLLRTDDLHQMTPPDSVTVAALAQGYEIANERTSHVRYLADLTVRFDGNKVRDFLRGRGLAFSQTMGKPVLVLPVLETAGLRLLWEGENTWLTAWRNHDLANHLISYVLPEGGLEDRYQVPASQALDMGNPAIRSIAARYGVDNVLVPMLHISRDFESGTEMLTITLSDNFAALDQTEFSFPLTADDNPLEVTEKAMAEAIDAIVANIDDWWKGQTLIHLDETGAMAFTVPLRQAADWPEIERRLERVTLVQGFDLLSFRVGEAKIKLRYVGSRHQVELALAQANLMVYDHAGAAYLILKEMAQELGVKATAPVSEGQGEREQRDHE